MTQQVFEKTIKDLLTAIEGCLEKQLRVPSLLLLYAGIDIMAWLNRPENHADVERADFVGWAENYLLPDSGLICNALDLYAARCALLHSFSAESRLSRQGDAKQIFYAWDSAREEDLQSRIDFVGTYSAVAVHVDELLKAFRVGVERFEKMLAHDSQHATLVYQRANKFLSYVPAFNVRNTKKFTRKKEYMYGKFYHDTYEFREQLHRLFNEFLDRHSELEMVTHNEIVQVKDQVIALLESWIGSKKIQNKLGIEIPLHAVPPSIESFLEKQARSYEKSYRPCEICGENRITDFCHVVPRSEGGPNDERNYVYLCPNHHHLFDNNRLSEEEWKKIDFSKKLEAAQEYAKKVRLPLLEAFWKANGVEEK